MFDKVEFECRCEDIARQENENYKDLFYYKRCEAIVDKLLRDFGYDKENN